MVNDCNIGSGFLLKFCFQNTNSFGYMLLHTEDLVDDRIPVKFAAMRELAKWVNSDASDDYICCLAVKGSTFMGSHDRTSRAKITSVSQNAAQLKQRYGKWRTHTKKNPKLGEDLHRVGAEGLSLLGYEPPRELADDTVGWGDKGYKCVLKPIDCGVSEPTAASGVCTTQSSTDFRAGGLRIDIAATSAVSAEECCNQCIDHPSCKHFTYDFENNYCYLKSGMGTVVNGPEAVHLISGSKP